MSAILPTIKFDSQKTLAKYFMPHQLAWILAEDKFHNQKKQVFALAEKSVRIGWTYADAFKNIRKRLNFPNRDYLFATKDYPSALEYMRVVREFVQLFSFTKTILSHGEEHLKVDSRGTTLTKEIKISYIKFDTGSRIIAFSAHPQAMAVYGGDVGLDEFAKHPNAELLWQTAQGRVTWGYDMAVWSSHEGDDTLFHQFALQARQNLNLNLSPPSSSSSSSIPQPISLPSSTADLCSRCNRPIPPFVNNERPTHCDCGCPIPFHLQTPLQDAARSPSSGASASQADSLSPSDGERARERGGDFPTTPSIQQSNNPWNLYFRVTITDAIELGLLDTINRTRNSALTPDQFLADCRARSGLEQIFQQAYLCNPLPSGASIVEWSVIERCRYDYDILRLHLEHDEIQKQFGQFNPEYQLGRSTDIERFFNDYFRKLFKTKSKYRLGFDVAASGNGDLAAIYVDEVKNNDLWLCALFTCRTDDWHFLKHVLYCFLNGLSSIKACGDASGLGRQICWEAARRFPWAFTPVNFSSKKHDLGFTLMNQLATVEKRFPTSHHDIAADFFALRKTCHAGRWLFSEGRNQLNPASHCDIAWAAGLASHANINNFQEVSAAVG